MSAATGTITHEPEFIQCAECGLYWHGWRGYRTGHPQLGEPPAVAFHCFTCAESSLYGGPSAEPSRLPRIFLRDLEASG